MSLRLENVTWFCFFASYFAALALELVQLLRPSRACRWGALVFSMAGLLAQTVYLVVRSRSAELAPLLASTYDWLLVLAWSLVLTHVLVTVVHRQVASGAFFLPLIVVLVGSARFVSNVRETQLGTLHWWGMAHASFLVLGIICTALSLVVSLMYLAQHHKLRMKVAAHEGLQLFSLEALGAWNWRLVVASVPLLTLGMACGVALSVLSRGTDQEINLFTWQFLILWLLWLTMIVLFAWVIPARNVSGRIIAWRTAIVCGVLLGSLLVLQIFGQGGIHGRSRGGRENSGSIGRPVVPSWRLPATASESMFAHAMLWSPPAGNHTLSAGSSPHADQERPLFRKGDRA